MHFQGQGEAPLLSFPSSSSCSSYRRHAQAGALPKYVHPALGRLLKNSPYGAFVKAYPRQTATLREIAEKEKETFATVRAARLHSPPSERAELITESRTGTQGS